MEMEPETSVRQSSVHRGASQANNHNHNHSMHKVWARANQATAEPTTTRTAHSHTTHDVQATLRGQCREG
jgi:hypothetical protein